MTQLTTRYTPQESGTVATCCDRVLFLGGCSDNETLHMIADRASMLPEDVASLDNSKMIVITKGSHGMVCDKIMWSMLSKTPDLDAVARAEAAAGSLNIVI